MDPATLSPDEVDALLVRVTGNWSTVRWRGHRLWQNLLDLNVISEHILAARPEVIVETGTFCGGSAIFFADMMRLADVEPRVISIDLAPLATPDYPGVHYLIGLSSTEPAVAARVAALTGGRRIFVVLDSDHQADHVYRELLLYAPLASVGDYVLVQDGNMHTALGLPLEQTPLGGIARFLAEDDRFRVDDAKLHLPVTSHVGGWLHRIA
jgi:cephalosporin hydroxylase